jgi:hypothetical protein
MLKILEQCLKSDPELNKLYVIQQIIITPANKYVKSYAA